MLPGRALPDPGRALRHAIRQDDDQKVSQIITWLLKQVPLDPSGLPRNQLSECSVIRGASDPNSDGLSFTVNDSTHVVKSIHRPDEVPTLGVGDRIVYVHGELLTRPLQEAIAPESVAELSVWKRAAMTALRARLARGTLHDALLETAQSASEHASSSIAARLLKAKASVAHCDQNAFSALHWAARRGQRALVGLLLEAGAPIEGTSKAKHTPLQLAVIGAHGATTRALLAAGANARARCDGRQLIHLGALAPCAEMAELLIDPAVPTGGRQDLNARSTHGWTALFLAAYADAG